MDMTGLKNLRLLGCVRFVRRLKRALTVSVVGSPAATGTPTATVHSPTRRDRDKRPARICMRRHAERIDAEVEGVRSGAPAINFVALYH